MWILFGVGAIIFAILNIVYTFQNKETKWFRYMSLSLTALTVCSFYSDGASRVLNEDISGLMDIMPTMSTALWICTIASIIIHSISLFKNKK